ncbi:MAG: histidine phosphotransferase family protein [Magnetospirillum sp.]|nr:histidine phosphotransferase family protein [Magnetospirillum sp.]
MENYLATQVSAASPGIALSWPEPPVAVDGATARLLLNLVLLAKDALPRGGRIRIGLEGGRLRVVAHGEPAALSDEARQVLADGAQPTGPRGGQARFAQVLAERMGGRLKVELTAEGLALTVEGLSSPPNGGVSPSEG